MLARRLLIAGGGGSFVIPLPTAYTMLFNGSAGSGIYQIGRATTTDAGVTWTPYGSNPVITNGAGGTWNSQQSHAPCVVWDGSQWVLFADGYDGTHYRIGRWTSADLITWTPYGSNPIMTLGAGGSFDETGLVAPQVTYNTLLSPAWKMWYVGFDAGGVTTVGYADSADGITWTKQGKVIGLGTAGAFNDQGVGLGCAILLGSTWTVFVAGQADTGAHANYRAGSCTVTVGSEATSASYSTPAVLSAFSGMITLAGDGLTYHSNTLTSVYARGSSYVGYGTAFDPTTGPAREVTITSTSADLATWTTPTGPVLPLSGWDAVSAENPSVVQA